MGGASSISVTTTWLRPGNIAAPAKPIAKKLRLDSNHASLLSYEEHENGFARELLNHKAYIITYKSKRLLLS